MKRHYKIASVILLTFGFATFLYFALNKPQAPIITGQPSSKELIDLIEDRILRSSIGNSQSSPMEAGGNDENASLAKVEEAAINEDEVISRRQTAIMQKTVSFMNSGPFTAERARTTFDDEDLPVLLAYLMDREHREIWPHLVPIVATLGDRELAVPVLIDFIIREDTFEFHEVAQVLGKATALLWLGELGGEDAEEILGLAITEQGARDLAVSWLNGKLPDPYNGEINILVPMQGHAAYGLVLTGDPDNIALVESRHTELLSVIPPIYSKLERKLLLTNTEKNTLTLFDNLAEMLVVRDLIEEMGREAFEPLLTDGFARWGATTEDALAKYGVRYISN